ncbi:hypothetical protein [Mycolicibacterium sp.]|uniref:hypothetical protein n=1 Tax=Mycolicibacterium sp. TaxID=2320850 RepID=UPI0037C652CD|nr:hypothetical protein [Mycobacterium sp. DSM 3803]
MIDAARAWASTEDEADMLEVGAAPRVDSFAAFARVFRDDEGAAWWVPAIAWPFLTGCAAVAGYALVSAGLPWQQGAAAPFIYALWFVVGLPGAIGWIWYTLSIVHDLRARPRERDESYAAWQRSGVLARSCPTGRSYRHDRDENPTHVHLLIRPDTNPQVAHRLRASVRKWLGDMADDAAYEVFKGRHVIPTEDIFGSDAAGGYLTDKATWNNWVLLLPPRRPDEAWTLYGMSDETARELSRR